MGLLNLHSGTDPCNFPGALRDRAQVELIAGDRCKGIGDTQFRYGDLEEIPAELFVAHVRVIGHRRTASHAAFAGWRPVASCRAHSSAADLGVPAWTTRNALASKGRPDHRRSTDYSLAPAEATQSGSLGVAAQRGRRDRNGGVSGRAQSEFAHLVRNPSNAGLSGTLDLPANRGGPRAVRRRLTWGYRRNQAGWE